MAANAVFAVPELLEMILLQLSFQEALRAIRVSKTFRDTIESSPGLQRKLYFQQALGTVADQIAKPTINPIFHDMLYYMVRDADIVIREAVEVKPYSRRNPIWGPGDNDYRTQKERISDAAYKQGSKYYVWFNLGKCRYDCMEEVIKYMRSEKQLWHGMSVTNRPCAIIVSSSAVGEWWFPPDIKMEELLRRVVKRYRYRRFSAPDSNKRAYDVAKKWTEARERRERKQKRKMKIAARWASLVVRR